MYRIPEEVCPFCKSKLDYLVKKVKETSTFMYYCECKEHQDKHVWSPSRLVALETFLFAQIEKLAKRTLEDCRNTLPVDSTVTDRSKTHICTLCKDTLTMSTNELGPTNCVNCQKIIDDFNTV